MNKIKLFAATILSSICVLAVGVASSQESPFRVGAEVGYICDGGSYEPVTNLNNSNSGIALKAALSQDGFEGFIGEFLLKLNQLPKSKNPDVLSDYFETTVEANISGENAYSLDSNSIIIKNKGNITITFNSPVTRVIVQVAVIKTEADLNNLQYQQKVFGDGSSKVNSITINGSDFGKCQYILIGKLTFRVSA